MKLLKDIYTVFFFVLCLFTALQVLPPLPGFPQIGLDPSWVFALNEATVQKLAFGKDIIFSYGPYSNLHTGFYDPANNFTFIFGKIYFIITFGYILFLNFKNCHIINQILILSIIILFNNIESINLFFPVLIFNAFSNEIFNTPYKMKHRIFKIIFILMPLGIFPLIKGTFLIICSLVIFFLIIISLTANQKNYYLSLFILGVPTLTFIVFWVISGQNISNIFLYFYGIFQISSGYTEAMSSFHDNSLNRFLVYLYIVTVIFLLYQLYKNSCSKLTTLVYFLAIFLAWKEGFVRHDGHEFIAYAFLVFISLLLISKENKNVYSYIILSISISLLLTIGYSYDKKYISHIFPTCISKYKHINSQLKDVLTLDLNSWNDRYRKKIQHIKQKYPLPLLSGTSDIYSWDQSDLFASGNSWNPRPIFQSYSAYTEELLRRNREHLISEKRPHNIFFRLQPIDNRYPSLDDGLSWPIIADNYTLKSLHKDFAVLIQDKEIVKKSNLKEFKSIQCKFKSKVDIPQTNLPLFVKIDIKPTLLGRIFNILLKTPPLKMKIKCKNGLEQQYRIIPQMASSGFFLSPLVTDTFEFAELISGRQDVISHNNVISLSIKGNKLFYKSKYNIFLYEFTMRNKNMNDSGISDILKYENIRFNKPVKKFKLTDDPLEKECDGYIDTVNTKYKNINITGWLVHSIEHAQPANRTLIIQKKDNAFFAYQMDKVKRQDVVSYCNVPGFLWSGFAGTAPIDTISWLGYEYQGTTYKCSNRKIEQKP